MIARTVFAATVLATLAAPALAGGAPERPSETWALIQGQLWPDAEIADGDAIIDIDAPTRAEDAAIVPVTISLRPQPGQRITEMTLIVEENPAPIAATFSFAERMGHDIELSTRLRVNAYSNVRVVATLDDGSLIEAARFVKASGGCAAPALKDADAALAALGKMKLRQFSSADLSSDVAEAQVMIRHPNNSGFQVDQVTLLTIPAFFVNEMEVTLDGEPLFDMSGGISLSEDPAIRFTYPRRGAAEIEVRATDTDGGIYAKRFAVDAPS